MDPQTPNPPSAPPAPKPASSPQSNQNDLIFNVMPQATPPMSSAYPSKEAPRASSPPPPAPKNPSPLPKPGSGSNSSGRKWIYLGVGIVVLLGLGVGAYYMLGGKKSTTSPDNQTASKLPKAWLQQYFSQYLNSDGTCSDQTICGDTADPDNDGLNNYEEFKAGTNPLNPDSDSDGLADGDEVHVYKTDPMLKYTDRRAIVAQNDWTDAVQIKNGYDPLTGAKFTDARKQQIQTDTANFHLHEPSITTLTTAQTPPANSTTQSLNATIQNNQFVPSSLSIKVGDTVVWTNKDATLHHIKSPDLPNLQSKDLAANESYSFTFTKSGSWHYQDSLHTSIKGTISVK
jgi:plastocyanin